MMRRFAGCSFALLAAWSGTVAAQDYPARPVRMIVPSAAGGLPDTMSRIIALRLPTRHTTDQSIATASAKRESRRARDCRRST